MSNLVQYVKAGLTNAETHTFILSEDANGDDAHDPNSFETFRAAVEPDPVPVAGTVQVQSRQAGGTRWSNEGSPITLTAAATKHYVDFDARGVDAVRYVPAGVSAGSTYTALGYGKDL